MANLVEVSKLARISVYVPFRSATWHTETAWTNADDTSSLMSLPGYGTTATNYAEPKQYPNMTCLAETLASVEALKMELLACLYHRGKKFLEDYESPGISCKTLQRAAAET